MTDAIPHGAFIVHPVFQQTKDIDQTSREITEKIQEIEGLVTAINMDVIHTEIVNIRKTRAATLMGTGTCDAVAALVAQHNPEIVIFDYQLSPIQQRNLEKILNVKIIDRTALILEIFGDRAQTKEGLIQVELAALQYQKSRLVRSWTHLERQRGGAGFMGGPGETQIELDRRIITDKITRLKRELSKVRQTRDLERKNRERTPFPIVALVGYTNAGKSTLFNRMTGASVYAEDLPFATLDPTMRHITLTGGWDVILSDTVGFIHNLPTHLIEAFQATLEQVNYADVIVHLIDISRVDWHAQHADVVNVLKGLDLDYETDPRIIEVYNKKDAAPEDRIEDALRYSRIHDRPCMTVSAFTGEGIEDLRALLAQKISNDFIQHDFILTPAQGRAAAWLHERADIKAQSYDEDGNLHLRAILNPIDFERFQKEFSYKCIL
jgi:GTP-binding protein HflX